MWPPAFASLARPFPPVGSATVWVIAETAEAVAGAYATIDSALVERPGHRLLISVPGDEVAALRRRLPHETVTARPGAIAGRWWLHRLQPVLVITLGADRSAIPSSGVAVLRFDNGRAVTQDAILSLLPKAPPSLPRQSGVTEALVRWAAGRPLVTLDDLRERLDRPATLLCLGNGPSSEDPALAEVAYDRLFRVNWIWRDRGLFTGPDVVFTADADLPTPSRPVICFPQRHVGLPILMRHVLGLKPPRGYMFLDQLPGFAGDLAAEPIPTNGALMVAVAAALRPRRIVIAGIDLYSHAAGRYPGDAEAMDGYSRQHSRDRDLALIRRSLERFDGKVTIFGASLRAALDRA